MILNQALSLHGAADPIVDFSNRNLAFAMEDGRTSSLKMIGDIQVSFGYSSTVYINGQQVKDNPLEDKEVSLFDLLVDQPLIVTKDEPSTLYHIVSAPSSPVLAINSIEGINDAGTSGTGPLPTDGILGLSIGASGTQENIDHDYFFAAVKGHGRQFGEIGGGIAVLRLDREIGTTMVRNEKTNKEEPQPYIKRFYFNPLDAHSGKSNGNCAYPIDNGEGNSNLLSINGGLDSLMPNAVALHWDHHLRRLFIAVQSTTKKHATHDQGSCALLVGRLVGDRLCLEPFAPHESLAQLGDTPFSSMGSSKKISLHKIQTLRTSTGALYLIIVGGNGSPEETNKKMFAFPVVDRSWTTSFSEWSEDPALGTLANNETGASSAWGFLFRNKFTQTKLDPESISIGGGKELPGSIIDMQTVGDSVWVAVRGTDANAHGLFASDPIFDEQGRIASWTPWKRSFPTKEQPLKFIYNDQHRVLQIMGVDNQKALHPYKSAWMPAVDNEQIKEHQTTFTLARELVNSFSPALGGVQGVAFFDKNTPGMMVNDDHAGLIAATGFKKVFLGLTSRTCQPLHYTFEGSALDDLGPITCVTSVASDGSTWLVAGGIKGLAILCDKDGKGIPAQATFEDFLFESSKEEYSWKKIGTHRGIQKLISGDDCLFVMTRNGIERVELSDEAIVKNELLSTQVFSIKEYTRGTITDAIIGSSGAIVATTHGLFNTAPGVSLRSVQGAIDCNWQAVAPLQNKSIISLYAVCGGDCAGSSEKKQIYVLAGSVLEANSWVYRFYYLNGELKIVSCKEKQDMLLNCKEYRRSILAEGSHLLMTKAAGRGVAPFFQVHQLINPGMRLGLHKTNNTFIQASGPYWTELDHTVFDTSTGRLMLCGNGGIYVRE